MAHLNETRIDSEVIYEGRIIRVERDHVRLENGDTATREVVRHPGGVCILALTDQDEVLLVRQYRYPHAQVTVEIPAGKLEYGENPEECGRRELLEECGCTAGIFEPLGTVIPTPAYCAEVIHVFLAKDLHYGDQSLDADEFLDVERMPFAQAVEMVLRNEAPDSKTQVAILKLAALRAAGKA